MLQISSFLPSFLQSCVQLMLQYEVLFCIIGKNVCWWKGPCLCPVTWGWWSLSRAIRLCSEMTHRKPADSPRTSVKGRCLMVEYLLYIHIYAYHTHLTMLGRSLFYQCLTVTLICCPKLHLLTLLSSVFLSPG